MVSVRVSSLRVKELRALKVFRKSNTAIASQILYLGRDSFISNTPFVKRTTKAFSPNFLLLSRTTSEERAERAVLTALYPNPALNNETRN